MKLCVTVSVTIAGLLVSDPSLARNVKLSVPMNHFVGVYAMFGGVPAMVPFVGFDASA